MSIRQFAQQAAPLGMLAILLLPAVGLYAQETETEKSVGEDAADSERKPVGIADVDRWERISGAALSNDGRWFTSGVKSANENGTLTIKSVEDETEYTFDTGSSTPSASFSHDSSWAVFSVGPPEGSSRNRSSSATNGSSRSKTKVVLLNLDSGKETNIENASSASFNGEAATWLALRGGGGSRAARGGSGSSGEGSAADAARGRDMVLYEIASGQRMNFGNVSELSFNKNGQTLAMVIDAANKAGNGIVLRDMASGVTRQVENAEANYRSLNWTEEGDGFCVLKGVKDDDYEDTLYSIVAFRDLDAAAPTKVIYDPQSDENFPEGMTISSNGAARWDKQLDVLMFGIAEAQMTKAAKKRAAAKAAKEEVKEDKDGDKDEDEDQDGDKEDSKTKTASEKKETSAKPANVVIWHWKDSRMQSEQQVQAGRDRTANFACMYRVRDEKFLQLEDEELQSVSTIQLMDGVRFLVGTDDSKYELDGNLDGQNYTDIYVIDTQNGERRLVLEKCRWFSGVSPEGDRALFFQDGHYHTLDLASGETCNITEDVPTTFWNEEDDHNIDQPPIRPVGWGKGGACVLLSDNWDIWCVPAHGGTAMNLTQNGKEDAIRYSRIRIEEEDEGIDLTHPQYFSIYGEWSKKSGFAMVDNGTPGAEVLAWDDCRYTGLSKAEDADVFMFTRQTFTESPVYMVAANAELKDPNIVAAANEDNNGFAWSSGVKLVDYSSDKGAKLQAALHLPADYEEGKQYPTIVYIYEKLSQGLHGYSNPRVGGFSPSLYTSQGFAVLQPDIVYEIDDPGMSAVWCVLPALTAAVDTGVVDPDHVAIHGHSWGGYQTAYLITQTDRFACAIAGAPLTNMISMYSSIYWNTGSANQPIFESSQGRFTSGYWDNLDAYARNSPVYHAKNVETPLMLLHNDKDGAVDWNQGIEYFNTLRRLKKPVVMLQYVGENHGVVQGDNRRDYSERMLEFFSHYLKGEEAPTWLAEGIPHLDLKDHLKDRTEESNKAIAASKKAAAAAKKAQEGDEDDDKNDATENKSSDKGKKEGDDTSSGRKGTKKGDERDGDGENREAPTVMTTEPVVIT
ncbi:MAG: prolyl oligopeptidase family serine peptidase [Pirellulales bacterium]|nr:prolyl oligopeptidase family serine peptidase [Pirellulales bacterium]